LTTNHKLTGDVQKSCPKCRYFIIHLMEVTNFFLATRRFFCSSCLVTKKLPPEGYNILKARCMDCKVAVYQSWADQISFIACLSKQAGERETESPARMTQDHDSIKELLQKLSTVALSLWNQEAVTMESASATGMPVLTYGEILLKCSLEIVLRMQPLPMLEELSSKSEEEEVVPVDDVNNNPHDNHLVSLSESSNNTAQTSNTSNQDQAMEDAPDMADLRRRRRS
jgi:hypothetical protein